MPEQPNNGGAQFRADLPKKTEQETVRTTIVGGRPPGSGQPVGPIPRGIEILLKKASVDAEFRELLLSDPSQAAASIELALEPVESAMLQNIPKEQLAAIIDQTVVPQQQRRAFLGNTAAVMFTVLAGGTVAAVLFPSLGIQPSASKGIRPDFPDEDDMEPPPLTSLGMRSDFPDDMRPDIAPVPNIPEEVRRLVAETKKLDLADVHGDTPLALNDDEMVVFRGEIYRRFGVQIPPETLKSLSSVTLLTDYIVESLKGYEEENQ